MIYRLYLLFCLLAALQAAGAQAPHVVSHYPAKQEISAAPMEKITIEFDRVLAPGSVHSASVKVFGRWSGPLKGRLELSGEGRSITLTPEEALFAGEWVTVSLSRDISSLAGDKMAAGFSWNFWVGTSPTPLQQVPVDTIFLRRPGEGLIQTYGAHASDLNNDGYSDLTIVNETSDDLRILLNDGTGQYGAFTLLPMGNLTPSPNEAGDFNGDGEIDLALSTAHHNELRVLFGDGQGNFPEADVYDTGAGARGLSVLDFNGDGFDDIFITNRLADNINLFTNDGTGAFNVEYFNTDGIGETACMAADANNDGITDIFIGMYNSSELALLLGDGQGGFSLSSRVSVPGRPWMIAAGDLNGDGFADVASANSSGNRMSVALGDGQGNLGTPRNYAHPSLGFPLAIDLGDLDGDGDLDIVTSNYSGPTYTAFENDGEGGFSVAFVLPAPNLASCAILHDRDNDGDLDISVTDEGDDVVVLFENPGLVNATGEKAAPELSARLFPNPCTAHCGLEVELKTAAETLLEVYNAQGQRIWSAHYGQLAAGRHQLQWSLPGQVRKGMYFVRLRAGARSWSGKILASE